MNPYSRSLLALLMSAGLLLCGLAATGALAPNAAGSTTVINYVIWCWVIGSGACGISLAVMKPRIWWPYLALWVLLSFPMLRLLS